ncbi:MAG: M16 family metallopeptidase [Deinococcales bacterium]
MNPQYARLENGLEVIAQPLPHAKSVAVSLAVRSGARSDKLAGTAHFLEHMMFKSGRLDTLELANAFDAIGAQVNAFTAHELTSYSSFGLPKTQSRQCELLFTMLQPQLLPEEIELEREVILEEIELYRDDPMSVALEQSSAIYFAKHPLGKPVIGRRESVRRLQQHHLQRFLSQHYSAQNMVLGVCGVYDWQTLLSDAQHFSHGLAQGERQVYHAQHFVPQTGIVRFRYEAALCQISLLARGFRAKDPLELAAVAGAKILGEAENSRLAWALVHRGLALSLNLEHEGHSDVGAFYGTLECSPNEQENCLELLLQTLDHARRHGVEAHELARLKRRLEVGLALRLETPSAWLGAFVEDFVLQGDLQSPEEVLAQIRAIRLEDVNRALWESGLHTPLVLSLGAHKTAGDLC